MKSWRGLAVIVLAAVGLLASIQSPMAGHATFQSPVRLFVSPLLPTRVISERTRWLFAHDVISRNANQQTVPQPFMSPLQLLGPSRTSDFMIGRVAVGIILPESNGVISPSLENWNSTEVDFIKQEVNQALQWWTQQAQARGISLEFVVPSNHPLIVGTGYEPIKMIGLEAPFGQADIWINDTMVHLGYNDPGMDYLQRVQKYDDDLRRSYHTDWAFTIFAVNGSQDGDGLFAKGSWGDPNQAVAAWAQRPGPYTVINNLSAVAAQWPDKYYLDNIVAHEIGHVFGAADEVWASGGDCALGSVCNAKFGYLSVENQNCDHSCSINWPDCVMRVGDLVRICNYSAGQIGWRDSNSNGLPDPVDTYPALSVTVYPTNPSPTHILSYTARITDVAYPTTQPGYVPKSINTVSAQYQIGSTSGSWITAIPGDGAWDSSYEENFKIPIFDNGTYTIYIRAINRVGHTSAIRSHTITINSSEPVYRVRLPIVMRN